ncbi:MAG: alpha/beta hydrolase [Clostridiales bacterium]|nr:alpha/beta hydrolase [Clostridiales bacterium]
MSSLLADYKGAPWLVCTENGPADFTKAIIPEFQKALKDNPMLPGAEIEINPSETPPGVKLDVYGSEGSLLYLYQSEGSASQNGAGKLIFYVHGGGFITGAGKYVKGNAILLHKIFGLPVAAEDYRLAPEHRWPAGLDDVYEAWNFAANELGYKEKDIIVAGESAGGNLALALMHRIKAKGGNLPSHLILISPSVDLTLEQESQTANQSLDIIFPSGVAPVIPLYADADNLRNVEVSPYFGDFSSMPPMYFAAGDAEVFLSDTLAAASKAQASGTIVKAHIFHGLWHAFPLMTPMIPESKTVFAEIQEFISD